MNPYAILGAVLLSMAALGGAYYQGRQDGAASITAAQAKDDDKAQTGAGNAVAEAKEQSVKIVTKIKTITREVPVYRAAECEHDVRVYDDLNRALRGAGEGVVPGEPGGASGQDAGGDDGKTQ